MRNVFYVLFVAVLATFVSCNDGFVGQGFDNTVANVRGGKALEVVIVTSNAVTLNFDADVVEAFNSNGYFFTVSIDGNTYTVASLDVTTNADALKVTKNPGANQVVYDERSTVEVKASNSALSIDIDAGGVITTGASVIIEEEEGL